MTTVGSDYIAGMLSDVSLKRVKRIAMVQMHVAQSGRRFWGNQQASNKDVKRVD
ncbi:hypothetical protein RFM68_11200 [Mesorhizobium sp. MSK_1335]|uniref:Uncharacterized protein n=1 Tax=Mesorhizobium montanum TaxID=3072323 RepID=A0ABU4ZI88_9HYPH|nr:hypothetical protein [Mesorhizobium sp. MSK_1335]MDX8525077.1 hypothetical protein [Mesorhizobium sp. MSK_1335]